MLFNVSVRAQETVAPVNSEDVATTEEMVGTPDVKAEKTPFLPTSKRIDRNVDKVKFVYKNEFMLGLAASYGALDLSDTDLMLVFDEINLGVRRTAVMP